jgi:hypothetical protein
MRKEWLHWGKNLTLVLVKIIFETCASMAFWMMVSMSLWELFVGEVYAYVCEVVMYGYKVNNYPNGHLMGHSNRYLLCFVYIVFVEETQLYFHSKRLLFLQYFVK